ncbi:MAG: DUF1614 domain-containing protein [Opitutaceae bacterium]
MQYAPEAFPFYLALWILTGVVITLIEIGLLHYVFESMGVSPRYMLLLLVLCLLGSYINIPVAQLPPERMRAGQIVDFFGIEYVVPIIVNHPGTVIAVNLGGAVVPFVLSLYLVFRHALFISCLPAIAIVTYAVHRMAHAVPGVGIAVPIFIPPMIAAATAVVISPRRAGPLAYVAGSLGTLIGADLLNLGRVRGLGAPVASIGGAGKFDGIFVTGLAAVLLAGLFGPRKRRRR